MARSRRKTPVIGMCGSRHHASEKTEKRKFNRKMRRANKHIISAHVVDENILFKHKDEVEDVWGFSKDGKQRIDPKRHPKEMRK